MYFQISVNDKYFNNSNNEYGELIFHRYTNMDNSSDTHVRDDAIHRDESIPLIPCDTSKDIWFDAQVIKYCPSLPSEPDDYIFLYGDYYESRYSWLRLVIHQCNN